MKRRDFLKTTGLGAIGSAVAADKLMAMGNPPADDPKQSLQLPRRSSGKQPNIIFILTDDHRWDLMSCMGHPFVETPHLDSLVEGGVHFRNAFVNTSLCSPSRATCLTGQYTHNHGVYINAEPQKGAVYYPQYLQKTGYRTAFIGKWHMGNEDHPRPGFDHWVSFAGQGDYFPRPDGSSKININGRHVPQRKYITDELTDYSIDWLNKLDSDQPFSLYLSHKGIHGDFHPAKRHHGRYDNKKMPRPETMPIEANKDKPRWAQNQRNSWHGVEFPYHHRNGEDLEAIYRRHCECMLSIDESIGRVRQWLEDNGQADNTLIVYMGDNGFAWGEHGHIDKRTAYEASMRVPLVAWGPGLIESGRKIDKLISNVDLAPTFLDAAGLTPPDYMDGRSFLPMVQGKSLAKPWRDAIFYEYFWEQDFPHTPTMFAIRTDRYKLIQYYGVWDIDECYDIQNDPNETQNLYYKPEHQKLVGELKLRLHAKMDEAGITSLPLIKKQYGGMNLRNEDGSTAADFPNRMRK